jgi:IclR family pca regulon transcriptional regulator
VKAKDPDFIESLDKGLRVVRSFDARHAAMSLSEVAERTGLTRASSRRFLHTLVRLGYARFDGKRFSLTARVLELGFAYVRSTGLPELVTPHLRQVSNALRESSSACVLEDLDVVYVARVSTSRIMSVDLGVGARLPAVATSMGRVMLAKLPERDLAARLARAELVAYTRRTITSRTRLRALLADVREPGYCLVDQELEEGLRSIAVPLVDHSQRTVAAINVSAQANRVSLETMRREFLPLLKNAADEILAAMPFSESVLRTDNAAGRSGR